MSNKVKSLFSQHLLSERDDSVFKDRERGGPPEDMGSGEGFEDSLDPDSTPSDFEIEDLGFDESDEMEKIILNIYKKNEMFSKFYEELVGPNNESNLTRLLALSDRSDSIANGALQQLKKPILNGVKATQEIKAVLDQMASAEPSLRKKVEALNAV
jgi:hypothetical protein